MFGLGVPEILLILAVILIFFGPKKLPELGNFLGKSLKDFRQALDQNETGPAPEGHAREGSPDYADNLESKRDAPSDDPPANASS